MAENSKIEWTHHTFNPWIGCTKVSPGCDHCYAEAMMADRYGRVEWGPHGARSRTSPANWRKPLAWNRAAAAAGERHRVFCASLADVFDNHRSIAPEWRDDLWRLIEATPNLDWLLLTKRPQNIAKMLPVPFDFEKQYPNVWLGTTVENQAEVNRRCPILLEQRAGVRFLSVEPLLEGLDLTEFLPWIDWVIVGGESGPHARPMHPAWARSLRDQCAAAGVAFLFKQWGAWMDERDATAAHLAPGAGMFDRFGNPKGPNWHPYEASDRNGGAMIRVGKKAAGRLLDGIEHNGFPVALPGPGDA